MTFFDWIMIGIMCFFSVKSLIRGAARETFSLLALLLAGYAASRYYPLIVPVLQTYINPKWAQTLAACAIIFLAVCILVNIIGWLLSKLLKVIQLGFLDKIAGALIGAAKAYIIICCLIIIVLLFPHGNKVIHDSALSPYSIPFIIKAANFFPDPLRAMILEKTRFLKK
ncbi:MAG: CvpA family protein [Pseudomonadota bacterium]